MNKNLLRLISLSGLVLFPAGIASAGKMALILHQGNNWQLQDAEKITINGKQKLRRGSTASIAPDAYKQMGQEVVGAAAIRRHRAGYMVERAGNGGWYVVVPDGLSIKAATPADRLWADAQIVIEADRTSKPMSVRAEDVFAILPGTSAAQAAVAMLMDEANYKGVGEKTTAESDDERMLMVVGVSSIVTGPALDQLKTMLAGAMNTALQRSSAGTGRYTAVLQGLRYADVSQKAAFASDPEQTRLRNALRDKKLLLDKRAAILKAFGAASEWDAVIDKYSDRNLSFEEYDDTFADLHALKDRASKESITVHTSEGKRLDADGQYSPALGEIQKALLRDPNNRELQNISEKIRIEISTHRPKLPPKQADPVKKRQILQLLTLAESYVKDGKLDSAEDEIMSAELIDASDPSVVLERAKLLRARHQLDAAVAIIDEKYNTLPLTDDEQAAGDVLKTQIQYEKTSGRENAKKEIAKAEEEGDYVAALKQARNGLQLDGNDPDLLYAAGVDAAITRNLKDAHDFWQSYLDRTQTLIKETERRKRVLELLPQIASTTKPAEGTPKGQTTANWFSNANVSPDLIYDPVSLIPNPHPAEGKGSKKLTMSFQWNNGELVSVRTADPAVPAENALVYFDYRPGQKGVRRVNTEAFEEKGDPGVPKLTAEGTVGTGKGTYVALANDPVVDPVMIEKLTGKHLATLVAGNAYFAPFIWDGVHVFLAEYDNDGHVKSARAIRGRDEGKVFDFTWRGDLLMSVAERGAKPGTVGDYRRDLHYMGNRLTEEIVVTRGRTSKISYRYDGSHLREVEYDDNAAPDGFGRKITFEAAR